MKKFDVRRKRLSPVLKKILLVMKLTTFILMISMLHVSATVYSQATKLSLNLREVTIKEVLQEIESMSKFRFIYQNEEVDLNKKINASFKNEVIENILNKIFEGENIDYSITATSLILIKPDLKTGRSRQWRDNETYQPKMISGSVTDSGGQPLPGVTVVVKGTTQGTVTNSDGEYSLPNVSGNDVLVFSFVGMVTEEFSCPEGNVLNVTLQPDDLQVEEVVVTALGLKRQEKSLGYGVSKVGEEEISSASGASVLNSIQGKVAGLEMNSSQGGLGSSNRVVLRGNSSITGNNQPLYIVDGVPINNSTIEESVGVWDRKDFGSSAMDINPDDIESITVLKGPNAAALYGSRAQNGAIVITTKSKGAKDGIGVEFSTTNMFDMITEQSLPKFQNQYGQGRYVNNVATYDLINGSTSWGPKMEGQTFESWSGFQDNLKYAPHPDNVKDFFETGLRTTNTLSFSKSGANGFTRVSYTNLYAKGTLPNNDQNRHNLFIKSQVDLAQWLRLDAKANFITQRIDGGTWLGEATSNTIYGLFMLPRNVDLNELKKFNYQKTPNDPFTGTQMNPYWTTDYDELINKKNRFLGYAKLDFDISSKFSGFVRAGTDYSNHIVEERYNRGHKQLSTGRWIMNQYNTIETNLDALFTYSQRFVDLSMNANIGGNIRYEYSDKSFNQGDEVINEGFWNVQSFLTKSASYNYYKKQVNSLYGTINLGYRDYLYFDASFRNDWSSTLPKDNRSYFYPAFSLAFLANELINTEKINLLKLRLGYAKVGNDTDPYRLATTFGINPLINHNGIPLMDVAEIPGVRDLKPELTTSIESGVELKAFQNRLLLDFNYYWQSTENQILETPVSPATGYKAKLINAGEVRNSGIEIALGGVPVRGNGLEWETTFTFAKNTTEIVELSEGIENQVLSNLENLAGGIQIVAETGKNGYGKIFGKPLKVNGQYQLTTQNTFRTGVDPVELGNFNPDAVIGWLNNFSYKRFSLKFLVSGKIGGDILNATKAELSDAGVTKNTLDYREGGIVVEGVDSQGNPITANMNAQNYWAGLADYGEPWVVDATNISLKEASLAYTFKMSPNAFIRSVRFSVNAYNLLFLYRDKEARDIDPNQTWGVGNGQGYSLYNMPSASSYGFALNVKF
ncbi:SusC/RagA family TonB-linked outer membrane protein [Mariniphaga sediminis]|uniref:SusC/RagA family TonB-linked outer membrane protein n=1 Tax=Mariniphaga sediminis TaxID=1628158 RepID=A0A399D4M2_9BACT|nr:SusC/RagA family TonB-linked outer membrane protein [Mariniphaga sediminis]RIH66865.1 SusC/RagA family TonB-linked outer membrane protein [Mariniphaga sediminis]